MEGITSEEASSARYLALWGKAWKGVRTRTWKAFCVLWRIWIVSRTKEHVYIFAKWGSGASPVLQSYLPLRPHPISKLNYWCDQHMPWHTLLPLPKLFFLSLVPWWTPSRLNTSTLKTAVTHPEYRAEYLWFLYHQVCGRQHSYITSDVTGSSKESNEHDQFWIMIGIGRGELR